MKAAIQIVKSNLPLVIPSTSDVFEKVVRIPLPTWFDPLKFVEKIEAIQTSTKGIE